MPLFRGRLSEGRSDTPVPPRRVRVLLRSVFVGSLLFPSEKRTAKEERPLQRVLLREVRKKAVQISFGRSRESAPPLHALIFYRKFLFIKSGNRSSVIFLRNAALKPDKQLLIFAEKKLFVAKELFIRKKDASDKHFPCGLQCVFTNCIKLYLVNKKCINTISCGYFFQKSKIVACATYKEARNMIYSVGLD